MTDRSSRSGLLKTRVAGAPLRMVDAAPIGVVVATQKGFAFVFSARPPRRGAIDPRLRRPAEPEVPSVLHDRHRMDLESLRIAAPSFEGDGPLTAWRPFPEMFPDTTWS
jgi:hypothetical protein